MIDFKHEKRGGICFYNCDNIEFMKTKPDNYYDLAIVDPPYGIGVGKMAYLTENKTTVKQKNGTRLKPRKTIYKISDWDKEAPPQSYFDELKRVSKEQILFGINYMEWEGVGSGRIKWDKCVPEGLSFKTYEFAYCSMIDNEITFKYLYSGFNRGKSLIHPTVAEKNMKKIPKRIHPTEKPFLLYVWMLRKFAKDGMKILDTNGGSMNIAKACDVEGFELDICEIDTEYFKDGLNAFDMHKLQLKLF